LENKLVSNATRCGLTLPEYVLQLLDRETVDSPTAKSGAELLVYW
jgi:hypothetical protein